METWRLMETQRLLEVLRACDGRSVLIYIFLFAIPPVLSLKKF